MKKIYIITSIMIALSYVDFLNAHDNALIADIDHVCLWDDDYFGFLYKTKHAERLNDHQAKQLQKIKKYYYSIASEKYAETYDYLHPSLKNKLNKVIYEQIMSAEYMGPTYYIGKIKFIRPAGGGNVTVENEQAFLMMFYIFRKAEKGLPVGNSELTSDLWLNNNGEIQVIPMPFLNINYQVKIDDNKLDTIPLIQMYQDQVQFLEETEAGRKILKRNIDFEKYVKDNLKDAKNK